MDNRRIISRTKFYGHYKSQTSNWKERLTKCLA